MKEWWWPMPLPRGQEAFRVRSQAMRRERVATVAASGGRVYL
jgi:hypothetical protein